MHTSYAVLSAILLTFAPVAPQRGPANKPGPASKPGPAGEILDVARSIASGCPAGKLRLGGQCLGNAAIRALGTGNVNDFGSCKLRFRDGATTGCDLYFTEVVHEKTVRHHATLKMITWFLTGDACTGIQGCLKGHKVGAKYVTELELDGASRGWTAEMTLYTWFQRKSKLASPAGEQRFMKSGSASFRGGQRHVISDLFRADGRLAYRSAKASPALRSSASPTTFLQDLCKEMVDELADAAGGLAGDAAGGLVRYGIDKIAGSLTRGAIEAGPAGWVATPFIYFGGKGLAHLGGGLTSLVTKSTLKTASKRWKLDSLCDEFADNDDGGGGGDDGGGDGGFVPPPPGGGDDGGVENINEVICNQCLQSAVVSVERPGIYEVGADGIETLIVYADTDEVVCLEWQTSKGADSNFDSFCD